VKGKSEEKLVVNFNGFFLKTGKILKSSKINPGQSRKNRELLCNGFFLIQNNFPFDQELF
jgi:hypothetical protein